jgi:methyl-accepting chemotaxis protein
MEKRKKSRSLTTTMTAIIIAVVLVSTTAVGVFAYVVYRRDSIEQSGERALAIASSLAAVIDPDEFLWAIEHNEKNEYHLMLQRQFDMVKADTEAMFLFAGVVQDGVGLTAFMEGLLPGESFTIDLGTIFPAAALPEEIFTAQRFGIGIATDIIRLEVDIGVDNLYAVAAYAPIFDRDMNAIGVVGINIDMTYVLAASNTFALTMAGIVIGVAVILIWIPVIYLRRFVGKPLGILDEYLQLVAKTGDIVYKDEEMVIVNGFKTRRDEIGTLFASIEDLILSLSAVCDDLKTVADGNLDIEVEIRGEYDLLSQELQKMVTSLNGMFGEIGTAAQQVASGSKQIADGSQSMAQGSTEQAASVQQLSSSIAEIAQKTKENAAMAERAAMLANDIKGSAEKGSRQMDEMMVAVKDINTSSQNISKVIKSIDDIAFQTNILALNAAVEAARAGQHGKGFAVVAEEVRNLAAKSAEAAKDTEGLIADSIEKAELGSRIADETAASLSEIVAGIEESNHLMVEIAKSSEEQSTDIAQINRGIDQVAQVTQQNSATAEQAAAASQEMSGQSDMLEQLIGRFKLKGDRNFGSLTPPQVPMQIESKNKSSGTFGKY